MLSGLLSLLLTISYPELFERHVQELHYLDRIHDRMIIAFSGTPGMGKSRLARHLEVVLGGVRISNDAIRQILRQENMPIAEVYDYLPYLFQRLEDQSDNHLLILDASIDRLGGEFVEESEARGWRVVVIRLDAPKALVAKRLAKREKGYLEHLDQWIEDYRSYEGPVDLTYDSSTEGELPDLMQKLLDIVGPSEKGRSRCDGT